MRAYFRNIGLLGYVNKLLFIKFSQVLIHHIIFLFALTSAIIGLKTL